MSDILPVTDDRGAIFLVTHISPFPHTHTHTNAWVLKLCIFCTFLYMSVRGFSQNLHAEFMSVRNRWPRIPYACVRPHHPTLSFLHSSGSLFLLYNPQVCESFTRPSGNITWMCFMTGRIDCFFIFRYLDPYRFVWATTVVYVFLAQIEFTYVLLMSTEPNLHSILFQWIYILVQRIGFQ